MSQLQDARLKLQAAEQAATAGDFASADRLLREAARIQEAELGPLHPDLASTLNNLAIVAERTGQQRDAEEFYRRAATIASVSLPPDHPMVAASRQNLEDFCRASGLPIDVRADTSAAAPTGSGKDEGVGGRTDVPAADEPKAAAVTVEPAQPSRAPVATPRVPVDDSLTPSTLAAPRSSRALAWIAVAVVAFIAVALLVTRPWASSDTDAGLATEDRASAPPEADATSVPPADAADALAEQAAAEPAPKPAPEPATPAPEPARPAPADPEPAEKEPSSVPSRTSGAVTLTVAEVCQAFSPRGAEWRCDPAGDSVNPGRIVLYTRVRSKSNTSIVHRWYHDARLRQTVTLPIRANPTAGYRTYSQQTVGAGGRWRVEVVGADGRVLHEQQFVVR